MVDHIADFCGQREKGEGFLDIEECSQYLSDNKLNSHLAASQQSVIPGSRERSQPWKSRRHHQAAAVNKALSAKEERNRRQERLT